MQFAFTEEQELLRREARDVLANGGWARDEVAELDFLDRAVLFEEAGRANRGDEFFDSDAPGERAARGARARGGRDRAEGARARGRVREDARAVRQADRHLPGRLAPARRHVRRDGARALARVLGRVVRGRGRRAGAVAVAAAKAYAGDAAVAACERSIQVHGGIGFTWEHVLHRYYKRALWIQAFGGYRGEAARARSPRICSIEDGPRHRRVVRDRGGVRSAAARRAAGACSRACARAGRAGGDGGGAPRRTDATDRALRARSSGSTGSSTTPASRSPGRSSSCRSDELRRQLEVNVVGQLR